MMPTRKPKIGIQGPSNKPSGKPPEKPAAKPLMCPTAFDDAKKQPPEEALKNVNKKQPWKKPGRMSILDTPPEATLRKRTLNLLCLNWRNSFRRKRQKSPLSDRQIPRIAEIHFAHRPEQATTERHSYENEDCCSKHRPPRTVRA
jgi:hypothetical protein